MEAARYWRLPTSCSAILDSKSVRNKEQAKSVAIWAKSKTGDLGESGDVQV